MQSPRPTGIKSSMLITLAWLLVACLVANRAEPSMAASLAAGPQQSQESAESAPATLIELAAAAAAAAARNQFAPIQQQQPQIVRRRRSSEQLWPANAAAAQRRFSRHQQKLAGDAAFSRQLSVSIRSQLSTFQLLRSALRVSTKKKAALLMHAGMRAQLNAAANAAAAAAVAARKAPASPKTKALEGRDEPSRAEKKVCRKRRQQARRNFLFCAISGRRWPLSDSLIICATQH